MKVELSTDQAAVLAREAKCKGKTPGEMLQLLVDSWIKSLEGTQKKEDRRALSAALENWDDKTKDEVRKLLKLS
jgi:hypothetical protein